MAGVASSLPELSSGEPEALPSPPRAALVDTSRRGGLSVSSEGTHAAELPGLSIVLPCFNEAGNLADIVQDALVAADRVSARAEVVIVDDGSTDGTGALAVKLAEGEPRVRLVMHLVNRG